MRSSRALWGLVVSLFISWSLLTQVDVAFPGSRPGQNDTQKASKKATSRFRRPYSALRALALDFSHPVVPSPRPRDSRVFRQSPASAGAVVAAGGRRVGRRAPAP